MLAADYVHVYAAYKFWRGEDSPSWPYVEKTLQTLIGTKGTNGKLCTEAGNQANITLWWTMMIELHYRS